MINAQPRKGHFGAATPARAVYNRRQLDSPWYIDVSKRRIVMSVRQMIFRLGMVLLAAAVLAGCSSPTATVAPTAGPTTAATTAPTSPAPTAAATVDLQPTFNAKTQSAATVIANLTQNAPTAAPVIPATATPAAQPTATAAPSSTPLPRATTAPTAAATATTALKPWTLVPTQAPYNCMAIDYSPKASVSYSPSARLMCSG